MNHLITAFSTGITAFTATNLDDLVVLLLFFSQVNESFRYRHIIIGQYLGFLILVLMSLSGFFSGLLFPHDWIGILGIVPIVIGISRLLNPNDNADELTTRGKVDNTSPVANFLAPQIYGVAAITCANGSDNISIYFPLFSSCTGQSLLLILGVFFTLVGVWCYSAYNLAQTPAIALLLARYGNYFVPFVLIGLGVTILLESHTLENSTLLMITLAIGAASFTKLSFNHWQSVGIEKN